MVGHPHREQGSEWRSKAIQYYPSKVRRSDQIDSQGQVGMVDDKVSSCIPDVCLQGRPTDGDVRSKLSLESGVEMAEE